MAARSTLTWPRISCPTAPPSSGRSHPRFHVRSTWNGGGGGRLDLRDPQGCCPPARHGPCPWFPRVHQPTPDDASEQLEAGHVRLPGEQRRARNLCDAGSDNRGEVRRAVQRPLQGRLRPYSDAAAADRGWWPHRKPVLRPDPGSLSRLRRLCGGEGRSRGAEPATWPRSWAHAASG